jgi:glutamine synthetase
MAKKDIFPAVSKFTGELAQTIVNKKAVSSAINTAAEEKLLTEMSELLNKFAILTDALDEKLSLAKNYKDNPLTLAEYYRDYVLSAMEKLRVIGDKMETDMSTEHWPYPSYGDMLYSVQ